MSRKGENIYQRKDGRWEGRYIIEKRANGKYRYGYEYADTYQEVKKKLIVKKSASASLSAKAGSRASFVLDIVQKPSSVSRRLLFRDFAEKWLDVTKSQVRESTYIKYRNMMNSYILPELGDVEWRSISRGSIERFCSRMLSVGGKNHKGLSPKTVSDIMSVIRHVFRYAFNYGEILPFDISTISVKREPKEMQVLSRKEQDTLYRFLYANLNDRNLGILICMFAGLRLGEICALRWEDISFAEQVIFVRQSMQRLQTNNLSGRKTKIIITAPKSRSSIRKIPIPKELANILFSYWKGKQGYVLTGQINVFVEPRSMERHFKRILGQAGLEQVNFHVLRHTFATRCIEMDFDVKSLSELLGHANVNITLNRYVHPSMELKRKNMQRLSALLAVK